MSTEIAGDETSVANAEWVDVSRVIQAVESDPHRRAFEKESRLLWSSNADVLNVNTAEPSLMRRFLHHPEFELKRFEFAHHPGDRHKTTTAKRGALNGWDGHPVYCITGDLPIGCLKVKSGSRTTNQHARIVSDAVLQE